MSKVPSRKECQQFFTSLDKTGDGKLQPRELVSAMVLEGFNEKEVMKWFADIDKDCDKVITYEEFINEVCKVPRRQTIDEIFDKADLDHSGSLSRDEMEKACALAGLTDKNALKKGFEIADKDGSGCIDRAEFIEYMDSTY
ncbi:uncharacterized protein LOC132745746 [Ruditapes philippinarum]|uniref:uncharacterized protein LOC132745746 n=1 Tax=Ruditapes philippinarum TaxID=129788 RepID=UPI00295B54AC|nr:uncharacterized protein LOC132745746 [Ruditapes philippinarum]XP_060590700.1 uncharacterized protein LOC132745746 [Ruditapes philippinarum]